MGQLIDDLLRLSRLSQRQLERTNFDMSRLAEEVLQRLRRTDPGRQVEASVHRGMMTNGDASLVRHLMENLIGNAWKFTSRTEHARIEVGLESTGGRDVYYVKDNGAGFDMQYAHKLLSAFQRLHHREEFDGTGHRAQHRAPGGGQARRLGMGAGRGGARGDVLLHAPLKRRRPCQAARGAVKVGT